MSLRPTSEQVAEARAFLRDASRAIDERHEVSNCTALTGHLHVLLRATEPQAEAQVPESLLAECLRIYQAEIGRPVEAGMTELPGPRTGIRAVLAHLAGKGVEASREMATAIDQVARTLGMGPRHHKAIETAMHAWGRLAPLSAALEEARAEIERAGTLARVEGWARAEANARAETAEKRLGAVMALTEGDLRGAGLGPNDGGIPGILNLIRSRATEGAEETGAPTDEELAREFLALLLGREPTAGDVQRAVELIAEGSLLSRVNIYVAGARRKDHR